MSLGKACIVVLYKVCMPDSSTVPEPCLDFSSRCSLAPNSRGYIKEGVSVFAKNVSIGRVVNSWGRVNVQQTLWEPKNFKII